MTTNTTPERHPNAMVWMLSLLMGLQPVGTDFYLPALPSMVRDLSASMNQGQLTLTAMLLGFGASQLIWGPASDRWGRKPTLRIGLILFALAALSTALAPTMEVLLFLRTIQGVGMGAVVVNARAIVRDHYSAEEGPRAMSKVMTGLGVFACVSGPLGGVIAQWLGWRAVLMAVSAIVCVALWQVWTRFEETLTQPNPRALQLQHMAANWGVVLRSPRFWTYSLESTATFGGLFIFLATSSFIVTEVFAKPKWVFGLIMFSMSSFYIIGTFVCRRLLTLVGLKRTVAWGGLISLTSGVLMMLSYGLQLHNLWAVMAPVLMFALGHGIHQAIGQSGAVTPFPTMAGTAAALSGFMQMATAFVAGHWIGQHLDNPVGTLAWGLLFWGVVLAAISWFLVPRFGGIQNAPVAHTRTPQRADERS
jgi:MFS transporter, DHA1 family, multidrug resistance protein